MAAASRELSRRARRETSAEPLVEGQPPASRLALLVVAGSGDLYGSDRGLLAALPEMVRSFDVTVAFPADGGAVEAAAGCGADVLVVPDYALRQRVLRPRAFVGWMRRCADAAAQLSRVHRRRRFDLIYSNTINNGLGPILRTLWRIPNVLHVHECPSQRPAFLKGVLLLAQHTSEAVVFNSAYTRGLVSAYQPRLAQRGTVVHIGIDLPPALAPSTDSVRLSICCPARIHPKKGQSVLVDAVGRAAAVGHKWDVHLYGDTLTEHEYIRSALEHDIAALALEDRFHWHGFVQDAAEMYRDADVCVVPSVVPEEYSMVCLEAQAFGRAVIATGPGGPSEVIVDGVTGLIVAPLDPAALAAALMRLDGDAQLRTGMGEAGRERVKDHFSRTAYGERIAAVCEDTIRSGVAGRASRARRWFSGSSRCGCRAAGSS